MKGTLLRVFVGVVVCALPAFAGKTGGPTLVSAPEFDAGTAALGLALAGSAIAALKDRFRRRRE